MAGAAALTSSQTGPGATQTGPGATQTLALMPGTATLLQATITSRDPLAAGTEKACPSTQGRAGHWSPSSQQWQRQMSLPQRWGMWARHAPAASVQALQQLLALSLHVQQGPGVSGPLLLCARFEEGTEPYTSLSGPALPPPHLHFRKSRTLHPTASDPCIPSQPSQGRSGALSRPQWLEETGDSHPFAAPSLGTKVGCSKGAERHPQHAL